MYLVDCDEDALQLARENVDMLEEEERIGRIREDDVEEEEGCLGVELIKAKVKYNPPKRSNSKQGRGVGRGGHRGGRGGRGRKGRGGQGKNTTVAKPLEDDDNNDLYNNPNSSDADDGIPLPSNIVDMVITK